MSDLKKAKKGWLRFLTKRRATAHRSDKAPAKDSPAPELSEQTVPQDSAPATDAAQQDSAPAPENTPQEPASDSAEQASPAEEGKKAGKRWGKKKEAAGQPK